VIFDPDDVNLALEEDGTLMMRVLTYDIGVAGGDPAEQFVPMPGRFDFRRPEW
jgi:hypothetical protein